MNTPDEVPKATDNTDLLKQQAEGCGAGCGCHSGDGACGKARWVICAIVLIAAGVLVVRAMTKPEVAATQATAGTFALPAAATAEASPANAPATGASQVPADSVGTLIASFAELNTIAASTTAVFVYLPGTESTSAKAPAATLQAAVRTLEAQGAKCALFTLRTGSPDYTKLGPEATTPGVLALVRGKGMSAVSGEITETKLVQGYVAAANAGGCGPSGCGPSGCP